MRLEIHSPYWRPCRFTAGSRFYDGLIADPPVESNTGAAASSLLLGHGMGEAFDFSVEFLGRVGHRPHHAGPVERLAQLRWDCMTKAAPFSVHADVSGPDSLVTLHASPVTRPVKVVGGPLVVPPLGYLDPLGRSPGVVVYPDEPMLLLAGFWDLAPPLLDTNGRMLAALEGRVVTHHHVWHGIEAAIVLPPGGYAAGIGPIVSEVYIHHAPDVLKRHPLFSTVFDRSDFVERIAAISPTHSDSVLPCRPAALGSRRLVSSWR